MPDRLSGHLPDADVLDPSTSTPSGFGAGFGAPSAFGLDGGGRGVAPARSVAGAALASALKASPFDVCHIGVVLRTVLFTHVVVALGVAFAATSAESWLQLFALSSVVALPGPLALAHRRLFAQASVGGLVTCHAVVGRGVARWPERPLPGGRSSGSAA